MKKTTFAVATILGLAQGIHLDSTVTGETTSLLEGSRAKPGGPANQDKVSEGSMGGAKGGADGKVDKNVEEIKELKIDFCKREVNKEDYSVFDYGSEEKMRQAIAWDESFNKFGCDV